jgi:hypothetical protein
MSRSPKWILRVVLLYRASNIFDLLRTARILSEIIFNLISLMILDGECKL